MRDLSKMLSVIETVTIKAQLAMQQQILYLSMLSAFFERFNSILSCHNADWCD